MPIILWAILVLTWMQFFSAIQYSWAYYTKKRSKDTKKIAIAEKVIKVVDWKLAFVMCIKVILENKIGLQASFPVMWIIDMLLMNFAVAELVVKYGLMRLRGNSNPDSKR